MEFPWPQKGKTLFTTTDKYLEFAHVGWGDVGVQFYGFIKGYKDAADKLVEEAIKSKNIAILDTYVYPVLFLYRQFLELSMKDIYLSYSNHDLEQKIKTISKVSHDLEKIWFIIKPIIQEGNTGDNTDDTLEIVEDYINQFNSFDKSSFRFRYPIDKKLNPTIEKEDRIDLANIKARMTELESFFFGIDGMLDELHQYRYEEAQEYAAIMKEYMDY